MAAGRPAKYKPKFHPNDLLAKMEQGALDCEIYAAWGISKMTFYRWKEEHKELSEAYDIGFSKCEAWWAKSMRQSFVDRDDKGFKYCIAIMNNKFGWDKGTIKDNSPTTVNNITVQNMAVLQNKSTADLLSFVKTNLIKNKDIIDVGQLEEDKTPRSDES